jgi:hypothetical protein
VKKAGDLPMNEWAVSWERVLTQREFWFGYYALAFDADKKVKEYFGGLYSVAAYELLMKLLRGSSVSIRFPKKYALEIRFDPDGHRLFLEGPSGPSLELGWLNYSFYSEAFRWSEYESLVGWLGRNEGEGLPGTIAPLLLLAYSSMSNENEYQLWQRRFHEGLVGTGLFTPADATVLVRKASPDEPHYLAWQENPEKVWVPLEDDYSLRSEVYGPFDHKRLRKFFDVVASA